MGTIFPTEMSNRGTVLQTDKFLIHNITTGATEYTTASGILAALANFGNVGIGTTAPSRLLHVKKSASGEIAIFTDGSDGILIQTAVGVGSVIGYDGSGYNELEIRSTTGKGSGIYLKTDGNIGIGTTTPTTKLQVTGLPEYNDNTNAAASGLTAGAFYRTGDTLKVVH
jgi:hypothetical protein